MTQRDKRSLISESVMMVQIDVHPTGENTRHMHDHGQATYGNIS
jgi:quercetin dioxygenase-like cupin family protein